MRRTWTYVIIVMVVALCAATCACVISVAHLQRPAATPSQVYTPSTVLSHVRHRPQYWLGRTVWISATTVGLRQPLAIDPVPIKSLSVGQIVGRTMLDPYVLWLRRDPPNWIIAALRIFPFGRQAVPRPQRVQWETTTRLLVRLEALPARSCSAPPCVAAAVLDAAPFPPPDVSVATQFNVSD